MTSLRDDILALGMPLSDHGAIAAALSAGRTRLVYTEVGHGTILETIGLAAGNALLDAIYATPDFRHVKPLLEQGRLDISSALVRGALDALTAAGVITAPHAAALKALAERPDPVSSQQVTRALEGL